MKTIIAVLLAGSLSGCVQFRYKDSFRDISYSAPAFGSKSIKSIDLTSGKERMEGYTSEQSQMLDLVKAAFEAGTAAGLAKAVKP